MEIPSLAELLKGVTRRAWHLEMRDDYGGTSKAYVAWLAGEPYDRAESDAAWKAIIGPVVERGVDVRRARVVSEPWSRYITYEHEITPLASLAAGERVRWLPRRLASHIAFPGNDYWLLDDQVLFLIFSGMDGSRIDRQLTKDPDAVELCATSFETAWDRGIDHGDYKQ